MYQFFVAPEQIRGKEIIITGENVNHIKNVLRMKVGEELAVSNGTDGKEYRCGIKKIEENCVECELWFVKESGVELPSRITLFQGLPKADKMELIIQKAVELGACRIVPVSCGRSIVKLDPKKEKAKVTRWQAIAQAAARQSKRGIIPEVGGVLSMEEALKEASTMDVRLIPYELADNMEKTREKIEQIKPGQSIAVFIGPEGGFEVGEIQKALSFGVEPITLGKRILRTETAGFTVLSWMMYHLEERS